MILSHYLLNDLFANIGIDKLNGNNIYKEKLNTQKLLLKNNKNHNTKIKRFGLK